MKSESNNGVINMLMSKRKATHVSLAGGHGTEAVRKT